MKNVLQDWVQSLSVMHQTVLLTAIRGPDNVDKYHEVKFLLRWYRRCILLSAMDGRVITTPYDDNGGSFTGPSFDVPIGYDGPWQKKMNARVDEYLRSLDGLPHHFQMHFMHAVEIVGYKHSDGDIRAWWNGVYLRLVHDMHVWPETEDQLDRRLGDDRAQWLERADAATTA